MSKQIASIMSEAQLQANIIDLARMLGYLVAHFRPALTSRLDHKGRPVWVTPMTGDPGFCDLVLALKYPPRLILVECKSEKGGLTGGQRAWIDALEADGCRDWEVYVWKPTDWLGGTVERLLRSGLT